MLIKLNSLIRLELDSPVDYKSHIVPICMPNDEEEFIGKKAFVTGWGRLKYGAIYSIFHLYLDTMIFGSLNA